MYKNKIVCALKHNNAPLIEDKNTVFIPFNTEYSIFLKNMNDRIAYISIFIDGKDINPGKKIKLYPKCTATIEKFPLTNHSFTFKERTHALQEVRRNQDEDGLIRLAVSYQVKTYINSNESITEKLRKLEKTNPYIKPFNPYENGLYYDGLNPFQTDHILFKGTDNCVKKGLNHIDTNLAINSMNAINEVSMDEMKENAYVPNLNQSSLTLNTKSLSEQTAENNIASEASGFTAPGKKKEEKDDILCYEEKDCLYEVNERFSFVIRLEESKNPIGNKEIKKICPTCEKKFKNKYFYCPFDGTFLDDE